MSQPSHIDIWIMIMHTTPTIHGFMDHDQAHFTPTFMDLWIMNMHTTRTFHGLMDDEHA